MFPRFAVGFGYILILLAVGLIVLGVHFMAGTIPAYTGSASVSGIGATVTIDRDEFAIPHIHAASERDGWFGLGYAEGQDRLFQMEFTRRIGQGRMSEIFGKKTYTVDAWSKTIGFARIADQMWAKAGQHTRDVLTAYTSGINQYIDQNSHKLGFEFDALKLTPEHWKPQDCMMIGRLMSWEMNFAYYTDASFGDISLALDTAHMKWLYPNYPDDGATVLEGANPSTFAEGASIFATTATTTASGAAKPTVVKASAKVNPSSAPKLTSSQPSPSASTAPKRTPKPSAQKPQQPATPNRPAVRPPTPHLPKPPIKVGALEGARYFFMAFREVQAEIDSVVGSHVAGGGSNAIAIAPSRTSTGGAILENDTHLELRAPARWYLAQMSTDDGIDVAGFCIAGLPAFLAGRNQNISWGITNGMADESDFFVEKVDSTGTHYTAPNGSQQKFTTIYDSIRIQDSVKSNPLIVQTFPVRMTMHGPIVSDMHPYRLIRSLQNDRRAGGMPDSSYFERGHPISCTWNGLFALSDELVGFIDLVRAKSIPEARSGLASFATPCLNIAFADVQGNIAYNYIGRLPRRNGNPESIMLPRDGSKASDTWTGFIWSANLPNTSNPARGYLVSANNPPTRDHSIVFGNEWEPPSRADRISELIEKGGRIDTGVVRKIMTDIISPYDVRRVLPYLLHLYPDPHPPRISPDSTSLFRYDSLYLWWKEDSMRKHSSSSDSLVKLTVAKDSTWLAMRRPPEDTIHTPKVDPFTGQVLDYLRNWDGGMRSEEIAPTIYSVFLMRLFENTFRDELGPERYKSFMFVDNVPLRTLIRILPDSANIWWDNIYTRGPQPETRDSIIQISFRESLKILARTFGGDIRQWQWGRLHSLTYHHPFESGGKMIAKLVNIEAGAMPGDATTVMQAAYDLFRPYNMRVGPSMRMIADMKTNVLLASLPTGNSEAIFGDHYRDMQDMYLEGELIPVSLTERKPEWKRFTLNPK